MVLVEGLRGGWLFSRRVRLQQSLQVVELFELLVVIRRLGCDLLISTGRDVEVLAHRQQFAARYERVL